MRTYIQGCFEVIESEDGKARFTVFGPPDDKCHPHAVQSYAKRKETFVSEIDRRDKNTPKWRPKKNTASRLRLPRSENAPGFDPDDFAIGDWVEWFIPEGTRVVGQIWSRAPRDNFWVTTDRSGVTGRVFRMERSKISGRGKEALYRYRVGNELVRSVGREGAEVDMMSLPDSLGELPGSPESYADHVAPKGYQQYAPVSVCAGKIETQGSRVWFPMVVDGVRMDADARDGEWLVSVPGNSPDNPVVVSSEMVSKGQVRKHAIDTLRDLQKQAKGICSSSSGLHTIREVEGKKCHECQTLGRPVTGNRRFFTYSTGHYSTGHSKAMCAEHIANKLRETTTSIEAIGDAQRVMEMRNSTAARAMVAKLTNGLDVPAEQEETDAEAARLEALTVAAERSAECAERTAEAAASKGAVDVDGASSDAELADGAREVPAEWEAIEGRASHAASRAAGSAARARAAVTDRQVAI